MVACTYRHFYYNRHVISQIHLSLVHVVCFNSFELSNVMVMSIFVHIRVHCKYKSFHSFQLSFHLAIDWFSTCTVHICPTSLTYIEFYTRFSKSNALC